MPDRTPDDGLIFDIGFALKRAGVRLPIEACRQLAAEVVAHLKRCRWEFSQKPPGEAHGSFKPRDDR